MQDTPIEWATESWNPTRGCTLCSSGCFNCYAKKIAERFRGKEGHPYEFGFDLRLVPEKLDELLHRKKPQRIFVNSMSDLFHPDVPVDYIEKVAQTMAIAHWHQFMVLTKRAPRMAELLSGPLATYAKLPNVWWGVSVENKRHGLPRIDQLRLVPTPNRFLSVEPLLEDLGVVDLTGIHWVIVGGESGPGARPIHADWVRSLRDQCACCKVPFFFKQWGGVRKATTGRTLDGQTYDSNPMLN